jgi:hypothetical protein
LASILARSFIGIVDHSSDSARRMGFEHEATPVGIDQRVALAPVDLLAGIVTARAAGLGGLDALAVDDRGRGAAVATDPFAICLL